MARILRLSAPWVLGCLAFQLALFSLLVVPQYARADEYSDCLNLCGSDPTCMGDCLTAYDSGCSQCEGLTGDAWTNCMNTCAADQCWNDSTGTKCKVPDDPCWNGTKSGKCEWSMTKSNCTCASP
jgi:hypothetical protein